MVYWWHIEILEVDKVQRCLGKGFFLLFLWHCAWSVLEQCRSVYWCAAW